MANTVLLKRSDVANKRPDPALMVNGELLLNYSDISGGVFYKNSAGGLIKVGPAQVSTTAPNSTPAGSTGNSLGEFWYDTSVSSLKIWDGSVWKDTGIPPSIFVAQGDILTATGPGVPAVLPVGSAGQILVANPSSATGLSWIAPDSGVYNGGQEIFGRTQVTTQFPLGEYIINFDRTQVSSIPTLTYSGGVFTNNTTVSRTYIFDLQATVSYAASVWQDWYIWFQKNSSGGPSTTRYGLAGLKNPGTTVAVMATQWSFTLAPGETVSCWTMVPFGGGQFMYGSARGNIVPLATKVFVAEVPSLQNVGLSGNTIEARADAVTVANGSNTRISWNNIDVNSAGSLTLSNSNGTFTNTSPNTRTYVIDFQTALTSSVSPLAQATVWILSGTTRYAEKTFTNFNNSSFVLNTAVSISLAPGEFFEAYIYNNAASGTAVLNGAYSNQAGGAFTIPAGLTARLKVVDTWENGTLPPGYSEYVQSAVPYTSGTSQVISWDTVVESTLVTLSRTLDAASGTYYFKNITGETRTYAVAYSGAILCSTIPTEGDIWVQYNSIGNSGSNRIGQTSLLNQNSLGYQSASVFAITLAPNEYFNTWIFANASGTLSGGLYAIPAGQSCRLLIEELSVSAAINGTISGVVAGAGLTGGGFTGVVTLGVTPATTTAIGGVIPDGTTITVSPTGVITALGASPLSITENSTVPANTSGNNGDLFLLTTPNPQALYQKVSGTWVTNPVLTNLATNASYNQNETLTLGQLADVIYDDNYGLNAALQAAIQASSPTTTLDFASFKVSINLASVSGPNRATILANTGKGFGLYLNGTATTGSGDWYVDLYEIQVFATSMTLNCILQGDSFNNFIGLTGITQTATSATVVGTGPFAGGVFVNTLNAGDLLVRSSDNEGWTVGPNFPTFLQAGTGISVSYNASTFQWTVTNTGAPGNITGVTAGTGLSGGGTSGNVTLNLIAPTGGNIGGVKAGTNITIAVDGTISASAAGTPGGTQGQLQFNNASAFAGAAKLVYDNTTDTFIVNAPITGGSTSPLSAFVINADASTDLALSSGSGNNAGSVFIRAGGSNAAGGFNGSVIIQSGEGGNPTSFPGEVTIMGSPDTTQSLGGGAVNISGGNSLNASGVGGNLSLTGGRSATPGYVSVAGGNAIYNGGTGANLFLQAGDITSGIGTSGTGGNVIIRAGQGQGVLNATGGNVTISPGTGSGSGTTGTVSVTGLATASTTATYSPATGIDLTNKTYVDNALANGLASKTVFYGTPTTLIPTVTDVIQPDAFDTFGNATTYLPPGLGIYFGNDPNETVYTIQTSVFDNGTLKTVVTLSPTWAVGGYTPAPNEAILTGVSGPIRYINSGTNVTIDYTAATDSIVINATGGGNPAGSNTQIQYNNAGAFGASPNFFYNSGTNVLNVNSINSNNAFYLTTSIAPNSNPGWPINIKAGQGVGNIGGDVFIGGGDNGGSIHINGAPSYPGAVSGYIEIFGGPATQTGTVPGDVTISGGQGAYTGIDGANVFISGGFSLDSNAGTVQITDISVASAKSTYTPTANTDLTTKAYVDTRIGSNPAGANTQVQYNNNGNFGAEADFAYTAASNTLTVGNITGTAANFALNAATQATTNANGYNIAVTAGAGNGTGTGGDLALTGGGGANGGNVNITAGIGTDPVGFSGAVNISGGTPVDAGTEPSAVYIYGSNFVNLPGATGGSVNIQGGTVQGAGSSGGDVSISGGSSATPGQVNINGGTSIVPGGTGANVLITGGQFAAGVGTSGTCGNVVITGGQGAGVASAIGGNVAISGGAGVGAGARGFITLSDIAVANATSTYTPTSTNSLTNKSYVDNLIKPQGILSIAPLAPATADTVGFLTQIYGGASTGTGDGGDLVLDGGAPATTGAYGAVSVGRNAAATQVYLKSPDGSRWLLTVDNAGVLGTTLVP